MIGKLFKYDFRITAKILFPLYAGILGIGVLSQTVSFLLDLADKNLKANPDSVINPSFLIFSFRTFSYITAFFITAGIYILTHFILINRYAKSMYGNEGYLTNTLPIRTYQLILIKFLNFWFWIFIGFVVIVISGILLFFNSFMMNDILQIFIEAMSHENYVFIILSQIISVSSTIMLLFLCVAIANIFKSYKLIIGIISYFIINSILAVLNYLIILIPYIFFLGNDFLEGSTSIYSISIISIFINIIEMIIMFFTILYIHRNYLNLE